MMKIMIKIFILLYLFHFGSSLPTRPTYELADFEMCAEADISHIEMMKSELFKLIPLHEITGDKKYISFGLLNEDWDRLDELAKRLPKDSILKSRLVKAFRLLIAALYQAHSKPIFQQCYDQRITTSKDDLIIQVNKSSNNISNLSTTTLKDKDDLEGGESVNWPRHKSSTTKTVKQVNDDIDNVAAASDNEETELSYPYTTPNGNLSNRSTLTFHDLNFTMSNDRDSIDESSFQKNTLNYSNKPKLQSTTENKIASSDTTDSVMKVKKLNNAGLENITASTIISDAFTTRSSTVVNKDGSTEEFGNQESASPIYVQTDKYTINVPHSTNDEYNGNIKPFQPFDTNLITPEENYPDSKELPNADITQSTTDSFEVTSLFSTKNVPTHINTPSLDEYDVPPKNKFNSVSTKYYSETVDVLFESSTLPFSTSKSNSSEYKEKDIDQDEEHTSGSINIPSLSDREFRPTTSSLSNNGNVSAFFKNTTKSQDIYDYESITPSSTSSYKSYTSTLTSQSSKQYKEDNVFTDSNTTETSTIQFQEYSTDGPSINHNISEIPYENINIPEDESTTKYVSRINDSNGIENKIQNNKETMVDTIGTENLPLTSSSPSKITKLSNIRPSSVTYDLDFTNTNDEIYLPTISIPISTTQSTPLNITSHIIPDQETSTTETTISPRTFTIWTNNSPKTSSIWTTNSPKTTVWTTNTSKASTIWTTKSPKPSTIWTNNSPKTSSIWTTNSPKTTVWTTNTSKSSTIWTTKSPKPSTIWKNNSPKISTIWTTKSPKTATIWTSKSPKTSLPYYFENPLYDENNNDTKQKMFPDVDSDIDFPEINDTLDIFESENESPATVKPTETFKYFTVAFQKLFESHKTDIHTNKLTIYPKGYHPKRHPQHKILKSCINGNQCVKVENHPYRYPIRFHKQDQVIKSDLIYNMPNHIIKSYEAPSNTYPKYFDTTDGKGFQWFPKQIMVRQKSEER